MAFHGQVGNLWTKKDNLSAPLLPLQVQGVPSEYYELGRGRRDAQQSMFCSNSEIPLHRYCESLTPEVRVE